MLDRETLVFWIAAQRIRLTPPDTDAEEVEEALDDIVCIHTHTDSLTLARRCDELLDGETKRCGFSA